ncbi:MAG: 3-isopropylmalate dehydratase small subunit [Firmicutes bacterium]|nr:3-isopropylmalate dehydratase small subunit [Bacillota bacterium]
MRFTGRIWRVGDNIDTDVIIAGRYLNTINPAELAVHVFEDLDPAFPARLQPGDVIVAGRNFGCGSSREHAPLALKAAGVACVVADSFARIFYRNAINIGLAIVEAPGAAAIFGEMDEAEIDLAGGRIRNLSTGNTLDVAPYPDFIQQIVRAGGLIPYVQAKVREMGVNPRP